MKVIGMLQKAMHQALKKFRNVFLHLLDSLQRAWSSSPCSSRSLDPPKEVLDVLMRLRQGIGQRE